MKIKLKVDLEIGKQAYKAGDVVEISDEQGIPMVCAGYAHIAKPDAPVIEKTEPVPAEEKPAKKGKKK